MANCEQVVILPLSCPFFANAVTTDKQEIRRLRKSMGLTQRQLAAKAGVSIRVVKNAEAGRSIGARTARKLANSLRVQVPQLLGQGGESPIRDKRPPFMAEMRVPFDFDNTLLTQWHLAMLADMSGDYTSAEKLLKDLSSNQIHNVGDQTEIMVKLATVRDNAGKSKEVIEELGNLLESDKWRRLPAEIYDWVRYHFALAYRRLAENRTPLNSEYLSLAQEIFSKIHASTRNEHQQTACKHQLGVIAWVKSQQSTSKRVAKENRSRARAYFLEAAERWKKHDNFREGYSLRRLAALEYQEGGTRKAVELWLDSFEVFSRHGCARYREEVRATLLKIFARAKRRSI